MLRFQFRTRFETIERIVRRFTVDANGAPRTKSTPLSQRLTMINWLRARHIRTGTRRVAFYFRYRRLPVNTRGRIRLRSAKPIENYTDTFLRSTVHRNVREDSRETLEKFTLPSGVYSMPPQTPDHSQLSTLEFQRNLIGRTDDVDRFYNRTGNPILVRIKISSKETKTTFDTSFD